MHFIIAKHYLNINFIHHERFINHFKQDRNHYKCGLFYHRMHIDCNFMRCAHLRSFKRVIMILYILFAIFIITLEYLARKEEKNNKNYYKKRKK
jgi:hypothetical protein